MSSSRDRLMKRAMRGVAAAAMATWALGAAAQSAHYPGVGRPATAKEVAAWDIDVRPDFKGLPKGSGTVAKGQDVWESKCASCHGVFGESNEVFSPLVGGTNKDDVKTGHVAKLNDTTFPGRTTMMKVASVSTLWDYINRAMPWTAPKSLSTDEVYSVVSYLLNMAEVLPEDFVLSDQTIAQAQARLPNRNGMSTDHGMWPGAGMGHKRPDAKATACMSGCAAEPKVASFLPDFARNQHGNLAEQNRLVGAQHGADTTRPPSSAPAANRAPPAPAAPKAEASPALGLISKYTCVACHGVENKVVGPGFRDVSKKYSGRADAVDYLSAKIKSGGSGVWGAIPMPEQTLPAGDAQAIARWIVDGAKK